MSTHVGNLILQQRLIANCSRKDLAAAAEVTVNYICMIECGKTLAAPDKLLAMAEHLDIDEPCILTAYLEDARASAACQWYKKTSYRKREV